MHNPPEDTTPYLIFSVCERELTPTTWDRTNPVDWARLRYESEFMNALVNPARAPDTRVTDALAAEPWQIFQKYGLSPELDQALDHWVKSFGLPGFDCLIKGARRTLVRWERRPKEFERKSWAPSGLDRANFPNAPDGRKPAIYAPVKQKRKRDVVGDKPRSKYIAFEWLALQHVFKKSSREIASEDGVDYSDVCKQIRWAAAQIGITPAKPKSGRPPGSKTTYSGQP